MKYCVKSMNASGSSETIQGKNLSFESALNLMEQLVFDDVEDLPHKFRNGDFPTAWIEDEYGNEFAYKSFEDLPKDSIISY